MGAARCSSSGSATPSSIPPSAMRSTRGACSPTSIQHVSFHDPPATATRHISVDYNNGNKWKVNVPDSPSTDPTNISTGGPNVGGLPPTRWRDNSPAAQAFDAFKTFFLGSTDATVNTTNAQPSGANGESPPLVSQPNRVGGPMPSTEPPKPEPFKPRFSPPWTLPGDEPSVSQPPPVVANS